MLETYLNGNLVNEPIDLDQINEHLYYSAELNYYVVEIDGNLTFTGDEYTYIREIFDTNICSDIDITIVNSETQEINFEGIIKVADVIFHPNERLAVCEVQNDNITAKVANNRYILCNLIAGRSKNDINYSVTTTTFDVYNPTATSTVSREGIMVYDALKSIVSFMSDDELSFESDYLNYNNPTGLRAYSVLISGSRLRAGVGGSISISFSDLFNDLNALFNLSLAFQDGVIRIEDKNYFKNQQSSVVFENVAELSQQLATETLYAKVDFGSAKVTKETDYLQDIRFNGHQQEEYHLGGQCNTDTELNLQLNKLITDTNIIQRVLPSGTMGGQNDDTYDEDVMILSLDSNFDSRITLKPASTTNYYFNEIYTNKIVAQNWLGQIPQSIYAFLGEGNDGCFINLTADQNNPIPYTDGLQCDQESPLPYNDVNGNYEIDNRYFPAFPVAPFDTSGVSLMDVGFYTAPANNLYSFTVDVNVYYDNPNPSFTPSFFFQRMASNTIGGARESLDNNVIITTYLGANVWNVSGGGALYLNTGDYVGCSFIGTYPPTKILAGATFEVSDPLGGVWQTYEAETVYNVQNDTTYPINVSDWKEIKESPFKYMDLTHKDGTSRGWLKDISRNLKTSESTITLIAQNG